MGDGGGVEFPDLDAVREVAGKPGQQADIEPWMLLLDCPQGIRECAHQRRHQRPHDDRSMQAGKLRHVGQGLVAPDDFLYFGQHASPRGAQRRRAGAAVYEPAAQVLFKAAYLQADRRWC
ncbi:hypothetical protein D3C85_1156310 [compost metagenome]